MFLACPRPVFHLPGSKSSGLTDSCTKQVTNHKSTKKNSETVKGYGPAAQGRVRHCNHSIRGQEGARFVYHPKFGAFHQLVNKNWWFILLLSETLGCLIDWNEREQCCHRQPLEICQKVGCFVVLPLDVTQTTAKKVRICFSLLLKIRKKR